MRWAPTWSPPCARACPRRASWASAGRGSRRPGCEAWYPMSRLSLRGYVEVVRALPGLLRLRADLVAPPARRRGAGCSSASMRPTSTSGWRPRLKRRGVRTIHYVSPSVWAWRNERIHTIARSADRLLALFPFEPRALRRGTGSPVTFVGHPAGASSRRGDRTGARRASCSGLTPTSRCSPCLPGSRMAELEMHSELLLDAAGEILAQQPAAQFLVPLISRETREYFDDDALPPAARCLAADHPLRPCRPGAARGRRRAGRVRDGDAGGSAVALPACYLLSRQCADRVAWLRASCCCHVSDCPTCWPGALWCRNSCTGERPRESCPRGAQSFR